MNFFESGFIPPSFCEWCVKECVEVKIRERGFVGARRAKPERPGAGSGAVINWKPYEYGEEN